MVSDWSSVVIVGGGAAGMAAAGRLRRQAPGRRVVVLDQGALFPVGTCGLPYLLNGQVAPRDLALQRDPELDARPFHRVESFDWSRWRVEGQDLRTGKSFNIPFDRLLLAPGGGSRGLASGYLQRRPGNVFLTRSLEDFVRLQAFLQQAQPRRIAIVGGGYIGVEIADVLVRAGLHPMLFDPAPTLLGLSQRMHQQVAAALPGCDIQLGRRVRALMPDGAPQCRQLLLCDSSCVDVDAVILATGVKPGHPLLNAAGVAARVDARGATSRQHVYAAGDCLEVLSAVTERPIHLPLARPAVQQGLRIADVLLGQEVSPPRPLRFAGTLAVPIGDSQLAFTGLSPAAAGRQGLEVESHLLQIPDRASYMGGRPISLQVCWERTSQRLVGAQAWGERGAVDLINQFGQALLQGWTRAQLECNESAYHPAFSSIWDALHLSGRRPSEGSSPRTVKQ